MYNEISNSKLLLATASDHILSLLSHPYDISTNVSHTDDFVTLQGRHNGRDSVSNHQPHCREVLLHVKGERVRVTSGSGARIRYTSRSRTL